MEVQDQDTGGAGFWWDSFFWLVNSHLPLCPYTTFPLCVCKPGVFPYSYKDINPIGLSLHPNSFILTQSSLQRLSLQIPLHSEELEVGTLTYEFGKGDTIQPITLWNPEIWQLASSHLGLSWFEGWWYFWSYYIVTSAYFSSAAGVTRDQKESSIKNSEWITCSTWLCMSVRVCIYTLLDIENKPPAPCLNLSINKSMTVISLTFMKKSTVEQLWKQVQQKKLKRASPTEGQKTVREWS